MIAMDHDPQHTFVLRPQVSEQVVGDEEIKKFARYSYPTMTKTQGNFKLHVSFGFSWTESAPFANCLWLTVSQSRSTACRSRCCMAPAGCMGLWILHGQPQSNS